MSAEQWLLLAHLLCAFAFVSGGVLAGALQIAARRRDRPAEIALLLGLIRPAVALVGVGALGTLIFGFALARQENLGNPLWLQLAFGFWLVSVLLGWAGGRGGRHTRQLAEREAAAGGSASAELQAALRNPLETTLNAASFGALLVILVLMVWQPT